MFETLTDAINKIDFSHTGLRAQLTLERLPKNRLGHAIQRTCDRLIYEQWRGHNAYMSCNDLDVAAEYLRSQVMEGTITYLLLGSLQVTIRYAIHEPKGYVGLGAIGCCPMCRDVFGQIEENEDLGNILMFRELWLVPDHPL